MIIFDIETGPMDESIILKMADPFQEPQHPGEFSPSSVKTGNLKDQSKINAKIEEAREKHEKAVEDFDRTRGELLIQWRTDAISRAALSPATGIVVAIGFMSSVHVLKFGCEQQMIEEFWEIYRRSANSRKPLVGHNIHEFDLPFLVRRSWMLGIDVPGSVRDFRGYWNQIFIDTAKLWQLGTRGDRYSLDYVHRAFGGDGKSESGKDFHLLLKNDRPAAEAYLKGDLEKTKFIAERMGVE